MVGRSRVLNGSLVNENKYCRSIINQLLKQRQLIFYYRAINNLCFHFTVQLSMIGLMDLVLMMLVNFSHIHTAINYLQARCRCPT